jgi:hypothetical protein
MRNAFLILTLILLSARMVFAQAVFETALEDSMFNMVNETRAKDHLPPLKSYPQVAQVAREHSFDMYERNYFAHIDPQGMDQAKRLSLAHIWYASCAENLGKTLSIENANLGFLESPRHRENILGQKFTHIGIGIYKAPDGYLYTTQNFIEAIDTVNADSAAAYIESELNKRRMRFTLYKLFREASIDSIATSHSLKMLKAEKPDIRQDFGRIKEDATAFHFVTPRLDEVFGDSKLIRAEGTNIGIGIVQGNSRKYGDGLMWITIIIVE